MRYAENLSPHSPLSILQVMFRLSLDCLAACRKRDHAMTQRAMYCDPSASLGSPGAKSKGDYAKFPGLARGPSTEFPRRRRARDGERADPEFTEGSNRRARPRAGAMRF